MMPSIALLGSIHLPIIAAWLQIVMQCLAGGLTDALGREIRLPTIL